MPATNTNRGLLTILVIALIAILAWAFLTAPDQRTTGERVGDAVDALPQGVGKAAEKLQDRTPGERIGDAVEDVGHDIKESTDR